MICTYRPPFILCFVHYIVWCKIQVLFALLDWISAQLSELVSQSIYRLHFKQDSCGLFIHMSIRWIHISSAESQKGINAVQQYSVENHKGAISPLIDFVQWQRPSGLSPEHRWTALTPFWLSTDNIPHISIQQIDVLPFRSANFESEVVYGYHCCAVWYFWACVKGGGGGGKAAISWIRYQQHLKPWFGSL